MAQEQIQALEVQRYLDIVFRNKKMILSVFLLSIVVGTVFYLMQPKIYRATATILYHSKRISTTELSPDVMIRTKEMLATLSQQVTSRTVLEEMITQFNLFPEMRETKPIEDVILFMRDTRIIVDSAEKGEVFNISFLGDEPQTTMLVTNALAGKLIEANLRFREERATDTSSFIGKELAQAKEQLDRKEEAMRRFRLKYYNEMVENRIYTQARLNWLQQMVNRLQWEEREQVKQQLLLKDRIEARKDTLAKQAAEAAKEAAQAQIAPKAPGVEKKDPKEAMAQQLTNLRNSLVKMRARYNERHPDVKELLQITYSLELEQAAALALFSRDYHPATGGVMDTQEDGKKKDNILESLEQQLADVIESIGRLREEKQKTLDQVEIFKERLARIPFRDTEWQRLTRDYKEFKDRYEKLVKLRFQADSAQNIERQQKGDQFKILDQARYPKKPFKPDFVKYIFVAMVLGLGLGGGIAFGLEMLDTSFKNSTDLENFLEIPVTASIPILRTKGEEIKAALAFRFWQIAFLVSVAVIAGGIFLLWKLGLIIL